MNRYDAEPNFDDALGHAIHWSLRGSVANTAPSAEVWARIKQRVYANESVTAGETQAEVLQASALPSHPRQVRGAGRLAEACRRAFVMYSGNTFEILKLAGPRRVAERLLQLCASAWRVLDEHTMSSEMVWRPAASDAFFRIASLSGSRWPMCGQMLPLF